MSVGAKGSVMTRIASKPRAYRLYAQECWELADHAGDVETRAVFTLTADAWLKLAEQVEELRAYQVS
jgi:hypothetical protein